MILILIILFLALFSNYQKTNNIPIFLFYIIAGIFISWINPAISKEARTYYTVFSSVALSALIWKAGLSLSFEEIRKSSRISSKLGFMPVVIEASVVALISHFVLDWSWSTSFMFGFIIAAVSPAVIIPFMSKMREKGNSNPVFGISIISTTIDDVVALMGFNIFLTILKNSDKTLLTTLGPLFAIVSSILIGLIYGRIISKLYKTKNRGFILAVLSSIFIYFIPGAIVQPVLVILIAAIIVGNSKNYKSISNDKTKIQNIFWQYAQIPIFFTIGASLFIKDFSVFKIALLIIFIATFTRLIVVYFIVRKTKLSTAEKAFLVGSNIPKATVQASVGSLPLALGLQHGLEISNIAVLAVLITAPIGVIVIQLLSGKIKNRA